MQRRAHAGKVRDSFLGSGLRRKATRWMNAHQWHDPGLHQRFNRDDWAGGYIRYRRTRLNYVDLQRSSRTKHNHRISSIAYSTGSKDRINGPYKGALPQGHGYSFNHSKPLNSTWLRNFLSPKLGWRGINRKLSFPITSQIADLATPLSPCGIPCCIACTPQRSVPSLGRPQSLLNVSSRAPVSCLGKKRKGPTSGTCHRAAATSAS